MQTTFAILILINLLGQCSAQASNTTPATWIENVFTSACSTIGNPEMRIDLDSSVVLNEEYTHLKTSYSYTSHFDQNNNLAYTQYIFKYYLIKVVTADLTESALQMSWISGTNGQKKTQTYVTSNTLEFIKADGSLCLMKLTNQQGDAYLKLFSFNFDQGATDLIQMSSLLFTAINPNEVITDMFAQSNSNSASQIVSDENYQGIIGIVVSLNMATSTVIVRKISEDNGYDNTQLYRFTLTNSYSAFYTNLQLGLQINGNSFYTYVCPLFESADFPYVYNNDQTAITTSSGLYSNHIVIKFLRSMMIATYDDSGQNGNIFFLINNQDTYALTLENKRTTLNAATGSLQYISDYQSFIIELNLDPNMHSFYIVWADNNDMQYYQYTNIDEDNHNIQIVQDFKNMLKISSFIYALFYVSNDTYHASLFIWIYNSTHISKYVPYWIKYSNGDPDSYGINKEFSVGLEDNLLENSVGPNFQVVINLKCICQISKITDMICFYANDACTFTVKTALECCNPPIE